MKFRMDPASNSGRPPPPSGSALPASWVEVLHKVEQALRQAVAEAENRERALPAGVEPAEADAEREAAWQHGLRCLEERLHGLQDLVGRAGHEVAEVDAALGFAEAALRQWLAAAHHLHPTPGAG